MFHVFKLYKVLHFNSVLQSEFLSQTKTKIDIIGTWSAEAVFFILFSLSKAELSFFSYNLHTF